MVKGKSDQHTEYMCKKYIHNPSFLWLPIQGSINRNRKIYLAHSAILMTMLEKPVNIFSWS